MRRRATTRRLRRTLLAGVAVLAVGLVVLLELTGALDRAELSTVDARFQVRGARAAPDDVMVVGIDDTTFSELDQRFPFSRRTFARALREVSDDHPRAIVYDVEFAEQSDDVVGDNRLVLNTRRAGNVVLSATEVGKGGKTKIFGGTEAQRFARATVGNGLLPEGSSGALRRRAGGAPGAGCRTRSTACGRCRWPPSSASRTARSTAAACAAAAPGSTTAGRRATCATRRSRAWRAGASSPAPSATGSSSSAPSRRRSRTATRRRGPPARWPGRRSTPTRSTRCCGACRCTTRAASPTC